MWRIAAVFISIAANVLPTTYVFANSIFSARVNTVPSGDSKNRQVTHEWHIRLRAESAAPSLYIDRVGRGRLDLGNFGGGGAAEVRRPVGSGEAKRRSAIAVGPTHGDRHLSRHQ